MWPSPPRPDDADLLARADPVPLEGRIRGDAGTEERGRPGRVEVRRDAEHRGFIHDDAVRIPAVGDGGRAVLVGAVVGEGRVRAELLEAVLAVGALVVGPDEAAHADEVADLEARQRRSRAWSLARRSRGRGRTDRPSASCRATRHGPCAGPNGRRRRRGSRSERLARSRLDAGWWSPQEQPSGSRRRRLWLCTSGHLLDSREATSLTVRRWLLKDQILRRWRFRVGAACRCPRRPRRGGGATPPRRTWPPPRCGPGGSRRRPRPA